MSQSNFVCINKNCWLNNQIWGVSTKVLLKQWENFDDWRTTKCFIVAPKQISYSENRPYIKILNKMYESRIFHIGELILSSQVRKRFIMHKDQTVLKELICGLKSLLIWIFSLWYIIWGGIDFMLINSILKILTVYDLNDNLDEFN